MTLVVAVDPGTTQSGFVVFDGEQILELGKVPNLELRARLTQGSHQRDVPGSPTHLAIEMMASYGMPVGREIFETVLWTGRFIEAWDGPHTLVYRKDVKVCVCNSAHAKDANISQALRDQFGWTRAEARKLGLKSDIWAALGVAVTWHAAQQGKSK